MEKSVLLQFPPCQPNDALGLTMGRMVEVETKFAGYETDLALCL